MKKILVLKDSRNANTTQSLSLANAISLELKGKCKIDQVEAKFNVLANLPNFSFISNLTSQIKKPVFSEYDIIIGCGRRLANAILYAKSKYGGKNIKTIAILNPEMSFKNFDLVVLPKHDGILSSKDNNVVNTNGAMCYFPDDFFQTEKEKFAEILQRFHSPFISIVIGGDSKHCKFSEEIAKKISAQINTIAKNMDATLLISTSRRTPKYFSKLLQENLNCSYYLYDFINKKTKYNPYFGMLASSDYFISTADSISMICEVSFMKKPVYIYKDGIVGEKYEKFLNLIVSQNSVKILDVNATKLENFDQKRVDDQSQIAKECLTKLNIDY